MNQHKKPLIILDIDGTLVVESDRLLAQTKAVAYHFGKSFNDMQGTLFAFFATNDYVAREKPEIKNNIPVYMMMMGESLGKPVTEEVASQLAQLWSQAYTDSHNEPELFPDTIYCLEELIKRGFELVVASGNTVATRMDMLEKTGITRYFSQVFAATDVGFQKQDSRFWNSILTELGFEAGDRVIVIGNQINDDIKNPIMLGIPALLIERPGQLKKIKEEPSVVPTAVYSDLGHMLEHPSLQ